MAARTSSILEAPSNCLITWDKIEEAASAFGTPLYLYLPDLLRSACLRFMAATSVWGEARIAYSLKTNPLPELLTDLRGWGAWVETVSTWEQTIARKAGYSSSEMLFNGPLKLPSELRDAIHEPFVSINIDSNEEWETIRDAAVPSGHPVNVGVRLCPPKRFGSWSRFGLEIGSGEAERVIREIVCNAHVRLACVHFHLGTQVYDVAQYVSVLRQVQELWVRLDLSSDVWLDIGGGYPFDHNQILGNQRFNAADFFEALAASWRMCPRPRLIVEPGRVIAAPAFAIVARTVAIKRRTAEPTIVVLDAGTNHNVMGAFYEHLWSYRFGEEDALEHRLCGPLCMEDDMMSGARSGVRPSLGSLVLMHNAGAYSMSLERTFIQPRAPVVRLTADSGTRLLRPREQPAP